MSKTETADEMKARIRQQNKADFESAVNKNWLYQGNKHVRNSTFFSWFFVVLLRF